MIFLAFDPSNHLIRGVTSVAGTSLLDGVDVTKQRLEGSIEPWVNCGGLSDDHKLQSFEHIVHPWMVDAFLQGVEVLAEDEISDDIEGGEIQPVDDVDLNLDLFANLLVQAGNESVTVGSNDGFLLSKSSIGE